MVTQSDVTLVWPASQPPASFLLFLYFFGISSALSFNHSSRAASELARTRQGRVLVPADIVVASAPIDTLAQNAPAR